MKKAWSIFTKLYIVLTGVFLVVAMATYFTPEAEGQPGWVRSLLGRRIVAGDSLRTAGTFQSNGAATFDGSVVFSTANTSKIDSFLTTAVVDTITMAGAAVGDVFSVTPYTPTWSATPDTGAGAYRAWVISSNTVVVGRTKVLATSSLKSAALYFIVKFEK